MGSLSTVDGGQQGFQIGFVRPVANVVGACFHQGFLPRLIGGGILLGNGLKISPVSGKEISAATVKHAYHVLKGSMDKAVLVTFKRLASLHFPSSHRVA
jgi:hypothetical protein